MDNPNTPECWDDRYGRKPGWNDPRVCLERIPNHAPLYEAVVSSMRVSGGEVDILDVGSGPGQVAWLYVQRYGLPKIGSYTGVDFSLEAEVGWNQSVRRLSAFFDFVRRDLDDGLPEEWYHLFDLVVCTETLEHLSDDVAVVREIRRVVRPGGRVVISVPIRPGIRLHLRHYGGTTFDERVVDTMGDVRHYQRIDVPGAKGAPAWAVGVFDV